ncbi:MAG: AAA family ATPase [Chitinivibrionales bacterium]|nr:AAA family ATPase [Chitinivibrionales bacterium]
MNYVEYWGLNEEPFEELCDTHFYFESDDHREALDRLLYVVNDRNMNMCLLTGEIGSGKTITKNVLQGSLPRQDFEVISFENSNFPFVDILYDICDRISFQDSRIAMADNEELPQRGDKYLLTKYLADKLETLVYEEKRHLVLIFDEAQQMESRTLDDIKSLTNISAETENYLTVFLIGQPELRQKISELRQVDQRIFLRFHLNNLDYNNSIKYIQHRMRVAGLENKTIFTSLGYELIFRTTAGVPREINRLCKLALNYGFAENLSEIRREDIQVVIDDISRQG